jgi:hypothetical protein
MCNKCENKEDFGGYIVCARIIGKSIELEYDAYSVDSSFDVNIEINFCPFCGKELTVV